MDVEIRRFVRARAGQRCEYCNLHKGTNIAGLDPNTGSLTPLFNPRTHAWDEHFVWVGVEIHGVTPIGRVTVNVLDLNSIEHVEFRRLLGGPWR